MDVSVIEASRWNLIVGLLSLDGVVPLYEQMGLDVRDTSRFVQLLRSLIAKSREVYGSDKVPDVRFANQLLSEIESVFSREVAEHFYRWATTVFYWVHSDQPQWSAWDMILPRHPDQVPREIPRERYDVVAWFRKAHSVEDVEEQLKVLKSRPLSPWDAEMYSIHSYSNKEDPMFEDDLVDPYSPILSTIEMNRFQLAWPKLWSHFAAEEKNLLWRRGQQFLRNEQIEMPGPLLHPDALRRQL